jgi:large subunit ribosomal protein L3
MTLGLIGTKAGMTRVFTEGGDSIPVTVIQVLPNKVSQLKTVDTDGYSAIQVSYGVKKANRVNKAEAGHFAKANVEAGVDVREVRIDQSQESDFSVGDVLKMELFEAGQMVDVSGVSKGKGFAGGVKRHGFQMQDATHGNSVSHRAPGSIGQNQTPGRVFKGKKMAGHMGSVHKTVQSLEVVKVDSDAGYMLVKGSVPGCNQSRVFVKPSVKA